MTEESKPLRIATRASALALWQAEHVAKLLRAVCGEREIVLVHISTHGDREQKEALHEMGGVGVFTREVQKAVLDDQADVAVHSLKDLPTESAAGLTLAGVPGGPSVFDALRASPRTERPMPVGMLWPRGRKVGTEQFKAAGASAAASARCGDFGSARERSHPARQVGPGRLRCPDSRGRRLGTLG